MTTLANPFANLFTATFFYPHPSQLDVALPSDLQPPPCLWWFWNRFFDWRQRALRAASPQLLSTLPVSSGKRHHTGTDDASRRSGNVSLALGLWYRRGLLQPVIGSCPRARDSDKSASEAVLAGPVDHTRVVCWQFDWSCNGFIE